MRIRVLLDECIPIKAASELASHSVRTTRQMGWRGKKNGELLQLAAAEFDVFVTIDRGLADGKRISKLPLGVIALNVRSNEIDALRPLLPVLRHAVMKVKPGQLIRLKE